MSMETYEEKMFLLDVMAKLAVLEDDILEGRVLDGEESLESIREKFLLN